MKICHYKKKVKTKEPFLSSSSSSRTHTRLFHAHIFCDPPPPPNIPLRSVLLHIHTYNHPRTTSAKVGFFPGVFPSWQRTSNTTCKHTCLSLSVCCILYALLIMPLFVRVAILRQSLKIRKQTFKKKSTVRFRHKYYKNKAIETKN